jgi:hypothetical protein
MSGRSIFDDGGFATVGFAQGRSRIDPRHWEVASLMREKFSLLVIPFLVSAAAGCQGSGGGEEAKGAGRAKESARGVLGAPPAHRAPRAAGAALPEVPAYSAYLAEPAIAPVHTKALSSAATRSAAVAEAQARLSRQAPGVVTSVDARRPVPSFVFAGRSAASKASKAGARARKLDRADQAAFAYLDQYRAAYQLAASEMATA